MAYDEEVAGRIRKLLSDRSDVFEQPLMGGLCFMIGASLCLVIFFMRLWLPESPRWLVTHGQAAASARVTLWDAHVRWTPGRWDLAALYSRGSISNSRCQFLRTLVVEYRDADTGSLNSSSTVKPSAAAASRLSASCSLIDLSRPDELRP